MLRYSNVYQCNVNLFWYAMVYLDAVGWGFALSGVATPQLLGYGRPVPATFAPFHRPTSEGSRIETCLIPHRHQRPQIGLEAGRPSVCSDFGQRLRVSAGRSSGALSRPRA